MEGIKEKIEKYWKETFQIRRETGRNPVLPQQRLAFILMCRIALSGNREDIEWLTRMMIKVREEAFDTLLFYEGKIDLAFPQLENAMVLAYRVGDHNLFYRLLGKYTRHIYLGNYCK